MSLHFLAGYVLGEHGRQSARLASAAGAAAAAGAQKHDVFTLHDRIDRLTLAVAAMWSLLEEQGMTEEQLVARIAAMDEADGVADGKMTPRRGDCTSCGAKVAPGLSNCQFCGAAVAGGASDPFSTI